MQRSQGSYVISGVGQNTFTEFWDLAPVGSSAMAIALSTLSKGDRPSTHYFYAAISTLSEEID